MDQLEEEVEGRNMNVAEMREELNKLSGDQIHLSKPERLIYVLTIHIISRM